MKHRKIAKLGEGGMAEVTLAVSQGPGGFNKLLVLKELRPSMLGDSNFVKLFLDEARVSARLQHPNIVQVYDVVSHGDNHYIVMEYLQGQPLNKVRPLDGWNCLSLQLHLKTLSEMLAALHYAHELKDFDGHPLNIVHRDVSPQNVFVCYDGQVKLVDFGVAKARGAMSQTEAGVVKGKLGYVAPEALAGSTLDRRADVFSAGVMLWEAVAKRKITAGRTELQIAGGRITGRDPSLALAAPNAPPELLQICAKAMALRSDDRYATALDFKKALDEHIETATTTAALGNLLSAAFTEEREKVSRIVQDHINCSTSNTSTASLPAIDALGNSGQSSISSSKNPSIPGSKLPSIPAVAPPP